MKAFDAMSLNKSKKFIAENGFDPLPSGLWARRLFYVSGNSRDHMTIFNLRFRCATQLSERFTFDDVSLNLPQYNLSILSTQSSIACWRNGKWCNLHLSFVIRTVPSRPTHGNVWRHYVDNVAEFYLCKPGTTRDSDLQASSTHGQQQIAARNHCRP